jgi:hypothetical protein
MQSIFGHLRVCPCTALFTAVMRRTLHQKAPDIILLQNMLPAEGTAVSAGHATTAG